MKGKLITLYGVNNMGKTVQSKKLVKRLVARGLKAEYMKYPVYDLEPSGPLLDGVLRGGVQRMTERELQLWFIVNRHQYQGELQRKLEEGVHVVAEDYVGTGIAWGMTKGLSKEWLEMANKGLISEDVAICMQGDRVKSATEKGHVHEEDDDLVERCYENFKLLCEEYGWEKVELQKDWDDTEELIWRAVQKYL